MLKSFLGKSGYVELNQIQGTSTWDACGTSRLGEKVCRLLRYPNQSSSPNSVPACGYHLEKVVPAGPGLGEVELLVSSVLPTLRKKVSNAAAFQRRVHGHVGCTRICKRLRSPGIDSEESIPSTYVAWGAGTTKRVVVPARQAGNRFLWAP